MSNSVGAPLAIEASGVRRIYKAKPKPIVALDGVDLRVEAGELFGLLGPNGAGKTTLIKILTTLLLPTAGEAKVFGFDVSRQTRQLRRIMNIVSGGEQSGYGLLQVREQLWMFSQFYGLGVREGWRRVDELIEAVDLAEQRNQKVSSLSTGQRQKLNLARGLLNDPWILFLDEPTLGLDVSAARAVRELVEQWQRAVPGRTILLTSHYMAEVEQLCDRIAIVDHGRILAIGTPLELKRRVQAESIFRLEVDRLDGGTGMLARLPGVLSAAVPSASDLDQAIDRQTVLIKLTLEQDAALGGVVAALGTAGSSIVSLQKVEPSLEDVFVELVGRGFEDSEPGSGSEPPDRLGPPDGGQPPDDSYVSTEPVESAR
ncbi:MAG TPA: ATP-binding cassette domain-containing protein [Candidatus Limnocylindria bacterium]|nr:ATP-binding cassette domain-containing protein [Candidatus Limnocylindria bacterium]